MRSVVSFAACVIIGLSLASPAHARPEKAFPTIWAAWSTWAHEGWGRAPARHVHTFRWRRCCCR